LKDNKQKPQIVNTNDNTIKENKKKTIKTTKTTKKNTHVRLNKGDCSNTLLSIIDNKSPNKIKYSQNCFDISNVENDVENLNLYEIDKPNQMEVTKQTEPFSMQESQIINKRDFKILENKDFDQSNKNFSHEIKLVTTSVATAYIGNQMKSTEMIYSRDESKVEKNDNRNCEIKLNNQIVQDSRFASKTEACIYTKKSSFSNQITSLTHQTNKNIETNETILSSNSQINSQRQLDISMKNRSKPKTSKEILQEIARLTNGTTPSYLLKTNKEKFDISFK
jgi:hypothetical protein